MRASDRFPLIACLATACLVACGSDTGDAGDTAGDGSTAAQPFDCTLGIPLPGGGFTALSDDATGELTMGFQGFLVVEMQVCAGSDAPDDVKGQASVAVDDEEAFASYPPPLHFDAAGTVDDASGTPLRCSQRFPLRLESGQIGFFKDRSGVIAMKLSGAGKVCVAHGPLRFVDEDKCVHTGEEPCCPGDPCYPQRDDDTGGAP